MTENVDNSQREKRWLEDMKDAIRDSNEGIIEGIEHQIKKFGHQRVSSLAWVCIVAEEFGEMVAEVNKNNLEAFEEEAFQTIACIVRLVHEMRREHKGIHEEEADLYVRQE